MRTELDVRTFAESLKQHWPEECFEPNLVDAIAASRGWLPLVVGEKMTVHYQGKEYEIKRLA